MLKVSMMMLIGKLVSIKEHHVYNAVGTGLSIIPCREGESRYTLQAPDWMPDASDKM